MKPVSQLDAEGFFVGTTFAQESHLEPGEFLIPGGAVDRVPPDVPEGHRAKFVGEDWVFEPLPVPPVDEPIAAEPTPEQLMAALTAAVQSYIDAPAQAWGYDDARSAVTYLGDPHPQFDAEAVAIRDFRSACWVTAGQIRDAVLAGTRPEPDREALLLELPGVPARPSV